MRSILALVLLTSVASADTVTSKTTALYPSKSCKTKIKGEGSDPVLSCPAVKGYTVTVSFSAIDTHVVVAGDSREVTFSGNVGKTLEWRMVGGKPFALLVEVADNDTDDNGKPITKNARIEIKGLGRSLDLKTEIKSKAETKRAWAAARALADAAK